MDPQGQQEREDWFGKYVVNQVTESDLTTGLDPQVTTVEYLSPPAWHHDDEDGLVQIDAKTWSQWRGYEKVRVTKGLAGGPQSVTEKVFYRGMDGDENQDGTVKDVKVTDSTGAKAEDLEPLSGQLREQTKYDGTKVVDRVIRDSWVSAPTATRERPWGTTSSFRVAEKGLHQDQATDTGRRTIAGENTYNADGSVKETSSLGDTTTTADDTCTRYEYTKNDGSGIAEIVSRRQVVAVACNKAWTNAQVLVDERMYYDGSSTPGGVRDLGDRTKSERLSGFDSTGKPTYQVVEKVDYDPIGRVTKTTNAADKDTVVAYSPAGAAPVEQTTVTQPNGQTIETEFEPAFGTETAIKNAAGLRSKTELDPLGRTEKIWLPGQDGRATPNAEYDYTVRSDGAGMVTSKTLNGDGRQNVTVELSDGLNRKREVQRPSADGVGQVITEYVYDSRGFQIKENGPYFNRNPIDDKVFVADEAQLSTQQVAEFGNTDQVKEEIFVSKQAEQWRTSHSSAAGRQTVEPPTGSQATTKITNAKGQVTELRQYAGTKATGAFDKTAYEYHPAGQLAKVTDPAGNVWSFDYDVRGRRTKTVDPDKGTTVFTYDDLDQLVSQKGSNGITVSFSYDGAGRQTAEYATKPGGSPVLQAEWKYDTVQAGALSSAIRYVDGQPYETKITGYDVTGKPTGTELTIPASEGALAGTYPIKTTYRLDGQVDGTELPAIGGLPAETIKVGYNQQNLPITLTGADTYLTGTQFNSVGHTTLLSSSKDGNWVQQGFEYDPRTQALTRAVTKTATAKIGDLNYKYDASGNVLKITDTPTGETPDTQCFGYDQFQRMTSAWTPGNGDCAATPTKDTLGGPAPYWHSWTFDKTGNRKTETRTTAAGSTNSAYTYPVNGVRPHALSAVTTNGKTTAYGYDAEGNQVTRDVSGVGESFTWDAEGRLESVTTKAGKTSYIYDANGDRLIRRTPSGTTLTIGQTELLLMPDGSKLGTRYYSQGGRSVAVRVGSKLSWVASELHNTSNIQIDAVSQAVQKRRRTPYGELRGAAPTGWQGDRGFAGGTDDASTGLVHLGAREYDQSTGRFISVDPVADFTDPQQLNGYAYANNSPVTFNDSGGRKTVKKWQKVFVQKWKTVEEQVTKLREVHYTVLVTIIKYVFDYFLATLRGDVAKLKELKIQFEEERTRQEKIIVNIQRTIKEVLEEIRAIDVWVPDDSAEQKTINNTLAEVNGYDTAATGVSGMWQIIGDTLAKIKANIQRLEEAKVVAEKVKNDAEAQKKADENYGNAVGDSIGKAIVSGVLGFLGGLGCGALITSTAGLAAPGCVAIVAGTSAAIGDVWQATAAHDRDTVVRKTRDPGCAYAMGAGTC
ncbi:hypothetical protein GCM10009554_60800 [Kribbella koreensis]|uniref:Teneurin-like YD-shell domain-containing protein n=1 Tax=Kribbella koreensis TaxID=57909 RepID=A0ABN1RBY3_9ACTN